MPDHQPRYVLSQRAADALRPLIEPGAGYGSRPRQIRDAGDGRRAPFFLECRAFVGADAVTGDPVRVIRAYIGPNGAYPPSIRINGRAAPLANIAGNVPADGWLELGPIQSIAAVWLVPDALPQATPQTYGDAPNWGGTSIQYRFDTTGSTTGPGVPPTRAPDANWPRWLHPLLVCTVDGTRINQGVIGGADISVEVGDADGTHSGTDTAGPGAAGGFCSVEQSGQQHLQLYDFRTGSRPDPVNGTANFDLVLRECDGHGAGQSPSRAVLRYMVLDRLIDYLRTQIGADFAAWLAAHAADVLNILAAQDLADGGPFWLSGGDSTTCYGSDVANMARTVVLDLDNLELRGAWKAAPGAGNVFQVDGKLDVTGAADVAGQIACNNTVSANDLSAANDVTAGGDLAVTGNATIGGNATISGDASAANVAATSNVTAGGDVAATGGLSGASLTINGVTYTPTQITFPDGTSLTVLAQ